MAGAFTQKLVIPTNATIESVLKRATQALKLREKKGAEAQLFFENGSTVDDIELLRNGDVLGLNPSCKSGPHRVLYHIAVMGPGAVGKSAITLHYVQNQFVIDHDPTIEDAYRRHDSVDSLPCVLDILDTAGQEEYKALHSTWMKDRDAFVLVFALNSFSSFQEVENFRNHIAKIHEDSTPPILLVGNKSDLSDRKVAFDEGQALARAWGAGYVEASAKTGANIKNIFHSLVRRVRNRRSRSESNARKNSSASGNKKKFWSWCSIL